MKNSKKLCKTFVLILIISLAIFNPVNATSNNTTTENSGFFSVFFNKLSKVSDLKSEINGTNVNLKWKKISNAYGYEVLINNPQIGDITLNASLNSLSVSGFPILDDNYTVKVRAYKMSKDSKVYGEYSDSIEFKIDGDSETLEEEETAKPKDEEQTPNEEQPNEEQTNEEQTSEDTTSVSKIDNVTPQVDGDTVQLNWSEADNADGYELILGIPGIGDLPLESDTPSKFIKGLSVAEGDYSVKVRAYKSILNTKFYGEYSDSITFNYSKEPSTELEQQTQVNFPKVSNLHSEKHGTFTEKLTWDKVDGADGYEIYVTCPHNSYSNDYFMSYSDTNTAYINDLGKHPGYYTAKVRAYKKENNTIVNRGEYSDTVEFAYVGDISQFNRSISNEKLYLSWNKVEGADGYDVELTLPGLGDYPIENVTSTSTTLGIPGLYGNFTAKVHAYVTSPSGQKFYGTWSQTLSFDQYQQQPEISQGSGLQVTRIEKTNVYLTWNRIPEANNYQLEFTRDGSSTPYIYRPYLNSGNFPLPEYGKYSVRVKGLKIENGKIVAEGEYSGKVSFTLSEPSSSPLPTPPGAVYNLLPSVNGTTLNLSWNKVSDAKGYEITLTDPSNRTITATTTSTAYSISNLAAGNWTVRVRAYKTDENGKKIYGNYSTTKSFTIEQLIVTPPSQVKALQFNISGKTATLSWNSITRNDSATIYYQVFINKPGYTYVPSYDTRTPDVTTTSRSTTFKLDTAGEYSFVVRAYAVLNGKQSAMGPISERKSYFYTAGMIPGTTNDLTIIQYPTSSNNYKAIFRWSKIALATGYDFLVFVPGIGDVDMTNISTSTSGNYVTGAVGCGGTFGTFRVQVRGRNPSGLGRYSNSVSMNVTPNTITPPGTVYNLLPSVNGTTLNLSWSKVSGAKGYEISLLSPNNRTITATTTSSTYSISNLATGNWTVAVRAYKTDESGKKIYGNYSAGKSFRIREITVAPPSQVKGLKATLSGNKATLSWNKATTSTPSATIYYQVFVDKPGYFYVASYDARTPDFTTTSTKATITLSTPGTYSFVVRAYAVQNGKQSTMGPVSSGLQFKYAVTTVPGRVYDLTVIQYPNSSNNYQAKFRWSKIAGATSYDFLVFVPGIGDVPMTNIKTTTSGNYVIGTLSGGGTFGTFKVQVRGKNSAGSGPYSNTCSVNFKKTIGKVTNLSILQRPSPANNETVILKFNAVPEATSYDMEVALPGYGYGNYNRPATKNGSYATVALGVKGLHGRFEFKVRAVSGNEKGEYSAPISFTYY